MNIASSHGHALAGRLLTSKYSMRILWAVFVFATAALRVSAAADAHPSFGNFEPYHAELGSMLDAMLEPRRAPRSEHVQAESARAATSDAIQQFARQFSRGKAPEVRAALGRLAALRPEIESVLRREGVPAALTSIVLVESGAQRMALSPKDARGLWQLMPDTARRYGLSVDRTRDDRLNTERATTAAARYLRDLYRRFGNWPLALAGYNAGEQAVQRALDHADGADFWRLSALRLLPEETRNYVPAVLAAQEMLGDGLPSPAITRVNARTVYASTSPGE